MDRQEIINRLFDHYERPRNHGPLDPADVVVPGGNPDCGDMVTIYLNVNPETQQVLGLRFEGRGCTISQAAASLLTEKFQEANLSAIEAFDEQEMLDLLGREVVRSRPRCATLALNTLKTAVLAYRQKYR